jgi:hypothetical protein
MFCNTLVICKRAYQIARRMRNYLHLPDICDVKRVKIFITVNFQEHIG